MASTMDHSKDRRQEGVALASPAAAAQAPAPWVAPTAERVDTPLEVTMYVARRR